MIESIIIDPHPLSIKFKNQVIILLQQNNLHFFL